MWAKLIARDTKYIDNINHIFQMLIDPRLIYLDEKISKGQFQICKLKYCTPPPYFSIVTCHSPEPAHTREADGQKLRKYPKIEESLLRHGKREPSYIPTR